MIADIERDLVRALEDAILGLAVEPFPDSPDRYRMLHQRGAVLVVYRGMDAQEPEGLRRLTQPATVRFSVMVLSRNLREHSGAYEVLDRVRQALLGFVPSHCGAGWLEREDYRSQEDGTWVYEATYAWPTAVGADAEEYVAQMRAVGWRPGSRTFVTADQY
jgi:hypothetical protein